jgi:putative ABC transport system substrate-binding protein
MKGGPRTGEDNMRINRLRRRDFITLLGSAMGTWPLAAHAQQPERMRRVAVLIGIADDTEGQARLGAFRRGLQALGWTEGRNVQIIAHFAPNDPERRVYARELVGLAPAVILANSPPAVAALRERTSTIPIVFTGVTDPVGSGFVASIPRPGGNITGFSNFEPPIGGKWLEVLKGVAPYLARVGLVFNPQTAPGRGVIFLSSLEAAGSSLAVEPIAVPVRDAAEIEPTINAFALVPKGGLIVAPDIFTTTNRDEIISLASRHRLPAVYPLRYFVASGGLMSYGIDVVDQFRRSASYVDRILKGEKPADLPVQAPTKFELVINLKTAKALGLEVPPKLLALADEVIE